MVIGDLNYDILTPDKLQVHVLDDLCDIFDLTNIVKNRIYLEPNLFVT